MAAELLVVYGGANPPGRLRAAVDGAICRVGKRDLDVVLLDLGDRPVSDASVAAVESAAAVVFAARFESGRLAGPLAELLRLLPPESLAAKPTAAIALHDSEFHPTHLGGGATRVLIAVHLTPADFADGTTSPTARRALDRLLTELSFRASPPYVAGKLGRTG